MGVDIHIRLLKYDEKNNFYKELALYRPGESYYFNEKGEKIIINPDYEKIYIYEGKRNSEMFDGMKNGDNVDGYGVFPMTSIKINSLEPTLKEEIEKKKTTVGYYDFFEINLAEMNAYILKHPKVTDYDVEWPEEVNETNKPKKENPIISLFYEICSYAAFADSWHWDVSVLSDYKILIYFDN